MGEVIRFWIFLKVELTAGCGCERRQSGKMLRRHRAFDTEPWALGTRLCVPVIRKTAVLPRRERLSPREGLLLLRHTPEHCLPQPPPPDHSQLHAPLPAPIPCGLCGPTQGQRALRPGELQVLRLHGDPVHGRDSLSEPPGGSGPQLTRQLPAHFTGMETEAQSSELRALPFSPSLGLSRLLPSVIPLPSRPLTLWLRG